MADMEEDTLGARGRVTNGAIYALEEAGERCIVVEQLGTSPHLTATGHKALTAMVVTQGIMHAGEEGGAGTMEVEEERVLVEGGAPAMPEELFMRMSGGLTMGMDL